MGIANVPAMAGEVDPRVITEDLGDVMTEAHIRKDGLDS